MSLSSQGTDHLSRVLVQDADLRGICVIASNTCREAVSRHGAAPSAGRILSEALMGGLLLARVHKQPRRINLQIECDGPLRGLVVDAQNDATVRGFVRVPSVHFPGGDGGLTEPAFGSRGLVNVLREMNPGQWYRGTVNLPGRSVARGIEAYLATSEQVDGVVNLWVRLDDAGIPDRAVGILFDRLPSGSNAALAAVQARLADGWLKHYVQDHDRLSAAGLLDDLMEAHGGDNLALLERVDVAFRCGCDRDRVVAALVTLELQELDEMIATGELPEIICEFCSRKHVVGPDDLTRVREALA